MRLPWKPFALAGLAGAALVLASPEVQAEGEEAKPRVLEVDGEANAFYVPPRGGKGKRTVLVWLHGRGGNPESDCRKWSKVATEFGWLLCPAGPEDRGGGARGWNNAWPGAKKTVDATMSAFLAKHKKRAKEKGNILIGFSEGAFVGMNIAVREPDVYSRWMILAANDVYWGMEGGEELKKNHKQIRRVYLLTGEKDMVVEPTRRVSKQLKEQGVRVMLSTPDDMGHEVPGDRMRELYRKPLLWLTSAK